MTLEGGKSQSHLLVLKGFSNAIGAYKDQGSQSHLLVLKVLSYRLGDKRDRVSIAPAGIERACSKSR